MKVRNGFVSNSSSSSFCIFGGVVGPDWYNDLSECDKKLFNSLDLCVEYGISDYYGFQCIGINPDNIDKSKTINEVEKELLEKFSKLGLNVTNCNFITDGGYNG